MNIWVRIKRIVFHDLEQCTQVVLSALCILKHVSGLLIVDSRDTVEKRALEAKCHWSLWVNDGVASFLDIDVLDLLLVYFGSMRASTDSGDEPLAQLVMRSRVASCRNCKTRASLPDCRNAILLARKNYWETLVSIVNQWSLRALT